MQAKVHEMDAEAEERTERGTRRVVTARRRSVLEGRRTALADGSCATSSYRADEDAEMARLTGERPDVPTRTPMYVAMASRRTRGMRSAMVVCALRVVSRDNEG